MAKMENTSVPSNILNVDFSFSLKDFSLFYKFSTFFSQIHDLIFPEKDVREDDGNLRPDFIFISWFPINDESYVGFVWPISF